MQHALRKIDPFTAFDQMNFKEPFKVLFENENFEELELQAFYFYTLLIQMKQRGQFKAVRLDPEQNKLENRKVDVVVTTTKVLEVADKTGLLYDIEKDKYYDPVTKKDTDMEETIINHDPICSDIERVMNKFVDDWRKDTYDSYVALQRMKVLPKVVDVTLQGTMPMGIDLKRPEDVVKILEVPRNDDCIVKDVVSDMSREGFSMDTYINVEFPRRRWILADKYYNIWNKDSYNISRTNNIRYNTFTLLSLLKPEFRIRMVVIDPDLVDVHWYIKQGFKIWFTDKGLEKEVILALIRSNEYGDGPFIVPPDGDRDYYYILPYNTCLKKQLYGAGEEIDVSRNNDLARLFKVGITFIFGTFCNLGIVSSVLQEKGTYWPINLHKFFGYYISTYLDNMFVSNWKEKRLLFDIDKFSVCNNGEISFNKYVLVTNIMRDFMILSGSGTIGNAIRGYMEIFNRCILNKNNSVSIKFLPSVVGAVLKSIVAYDFAFRLEGDLYYKGDDPDLRRVYYLNNTVYKDRYILMKNNKYGSEERRDFKVMTSESIVREVSVQVDNVTERGVSLNNSLSTVMFLKNLRDKRYVVKEGRNYFTLKALPVTTYNGNKGYVGYNSNNKNRPTGTKWRKSNVDMNNNGELVDKEVNKQKSDNFMRNYKNRDIEKISLLNSKAVYVKKSDNVRSSLIKKKKKEYSGSQVKFKDKDE
jgi:hypothetical protein